MAKIFGIGLGKTGTKSLVEALRLLGYNAAHRLPQEAGIVDEYEALADTPIATQFELLDQLFPHSKFICTIRNIDSWLKSCQQHFSKPHNRAVDNIYRLKMFGSLVFDEEKFRHAYDLHTTRVASYFEGREADLLYYDIVGGDSWPKLCKFLGKPVPAFRFPHRNQAGDELPWVA